MYYLFLIIVFVIILIRMSRFEKKLERLEEIIQRMSSSQPVATAASPETVATGAVEQISTAEFKSGFDSEQTEKEDIEPKEPSFSVVAWFREDWMMKLGALLLLLGFAWLVTYAFMNNWIGPVGRISFGIVGGLAVLLVGEFRTTKSLPQGALLLGLGSGIIMLTIYAARELYDFFTPASALVIMALVAAFIALSSYRHKYKPLAVLGLLLGMLAPLLTSSPSRDIIGLFSYLFVVSAGFLWVVRLTKWRLLTVLSFIAIVFYGLVFINVKGDDKLIMLVTVSVFTLLYFFTTLLAIIKDAKANKTDLLVAGMSGIYFLFWVNDLVPDELKGLLAALAALIFVLGAFLTYQLTKLKDPVYLYSGVALILLGAATAFELEGAALTIAFTLEAFVISVLTTLFSRNVLTGQKVSALMFLPMFLSARSMEIYRWRNSLIQEDFFVLVIIAAAFIFLGAFFFHFSHGQAEEKNIKKNTAAHFIIGAIYILVLIRLILEPLTEDRDTAKTVSLVIYTIIGIFFYLKGKFNDNKFFWLPGGLLLAYVGGRLLLIEVWQMDLVGRIVTFFTTGGLLIASAFIKPKNHSIKQ